MNLIIRAFLGGFGQIQYISKHISNMELYYACDPNGIIEMVVEGFHYNMEMIRLYWSTAFGKEIEAERYEICFLDDDYNYEKRLCFKDIHEIKKFRLGSIQ